MFRSGLVLLISFLVFTASAMEKQPVADHDDTPVPCKVNVAEQFAPHDEAIIGDLLKRTRPTNVTDMPESIRQSLIMRGVRWCWHRVKKPLFNHVVVPIFVNFLPVVVKPLGNAVGTGVDCIAQKSFQWRLSERFEHIAHEVKTASKVAGYFIVAGGLDYAVRRGQHSMARYELGRSFPGAVSNMGMGLRIAGAGVCTYGALRQALQYFNSRVHVKQPVIIQRALAKEMPNDEAIELPGFLHDYALRFKNGRADGDLANTYSTMVLAGSADSEHKKLLLGAFARTVGEQVPVYTIDYAAVVASVREGRSIAVVMQKLIAEAIGRAGFAGMPLAIFCLDDFEQWIRDEQNVGTREALVATLPMLMGHNVQAYVYHHVGSRRCQETESQEDDEDDSVHHKGANGVLEKIEKDLAGDDEGMTVIIAQLFKAMRLELTDQYKHLIDRKTAVNGLLVGISGAASAGESDTLEQFCNERFKNVDGSPSSAFSFQVKYGADGTISAKHPPVGLPWELSVLLRNATRKKDDKNENGQQAIYVTDVPAQTLQAWPGSHPAEFDRLLDQFQHPERYAVLRNTGEMASSQRMLLYGVPGTGKTKLISALAGSLQAPIISINVGALRGPDDIDKAFKQAMMIAREQSAGRVVLFIDDIDFMCGRREEVSDASKQVLWRMLSQLDGFDRASDRVIVIATSNTPPNELDPALVRSGRFSRLVELKLPKQCDRAAILSFYVNKLCGAEQAASLGVTINDSDIQALAHKTKGCTPADLQLLVSEAACCAVHQQKTLTNEQFNAVWREMDEQRRSVEHTDDGVSSVDRRLERRMSS